MACAKGVEMKISIWSQLLMCQLPAWNIRPRCAKVLRWECWNKMCLCVLAPCKLKINQHIASCNILALLKSIMSNTHTYEQRWTTHVCVTTRFLQTSCTLHRLPLFVRRVVFALHSYLLQIASASSEPSAHSGSPSQRQRAGTHCPFLQAKSVVAHVFFAAETEERETRWLLHGRAQRSSSVGIWKVTGWHWTMNTWMYYSGGGEAPSILRLSHQTLMTQVT